MQELTPLAASGVVGISLALIWLLRDISKGNHAAMSQLADVMRQQNEILQSHQQKHISALEEEAKAKIEMARVIERLSGEVKNCPVKAKAFSR